MSGNCELGRGLRGREKNANKAGAGRFEKPAPDARARSSRDSRVAHLPEDRWRSAIDRAILHPRNKQDVGRRLAAWALADVYGKPVPARSGPLPAGNDVRGAEIVCRFTDAEGLRDRDGGDLEGFLIAGADRQWKPATARIDGTSVAVSAVDVTSPTAVRYGWASNPKCDLVNAAGLPASPFRTDTWPIEAAPATKR